MSCLRLGLATAIDNPKSGDRTTEVVGAADLAAEGGIPDFAVDQNLLDPTLLLLGRCLQEFASIAVELPIIEIKAGRVGWCQYIIKPAPDDGSEILVGQRADGLALQIAPVRGGSARARRAASAYPPPTTNGTGRSNGR